MKWSVWTYSCDTNLLIIFPDFILALRNILGYEQPDLILLPYLEVVYKSWGLEYASSRKFLMRWEYQTTWPGSWEICMQVKKLQIELDMEQQTGSKMGKEYVKAVYCHPAYPTYMQSTSWEMRAGWSTSWNQDCQEKYQ